MYFNDKEDTNIDDEFNNDNILIKLTRFILNNKIYFIIGLILLMFIIIITISLFNKENYYLELEGESNITIYQYSDYIEFGYKAYSSKNKNLTNQVNIKSTVDTSRIGEYEVIYTLKDTTKTRKVYVIERPEEYTYIYLNPVNNSTTIYLKVGEEYQEPGYIVFNSFTDDLTKLVSIDGNVDTSQKGTYKLVYSVVDSNNVTISVVRTIIVMDTEVSLTLNNTNYTNGEVGINVYIDDNYFDYMILPDGNKITNTIYEYKVNTNGTYTFKFYNNKGIEKEESIEVTNIDKEKPTGSCSGVYGNGTSVITISASDNIGIYKYEVNNKSYTNNKITINSEMTNANVIIYDLAMNKTIINCNLSKNNKQTSSTSSNSNAPVINNITNDGVIVTINASKKNADISGYYFSYTSTKPDKNGGYLSTNKTSLDIVRLPGTTYVWVEDKNGNISAPMTITLSTDIIPITKIGYTVLQGTKLSDYISSKGDSIDDLNKLIARSVRAGGLYTKTGAATAAVALQVVLIQKYKIKIPYWMGGKTTSYGAYSDWGKYYANPTYSGYYYYGMDCGGFVNWSYKNTGVVYSDMNKNNYFFWDGIEYSKENGEVGDVLRRYAKNGRTEHVALIVGKTDTYFIVAEAYGKTNGIIINKYYYTEPNDYTIIKGETLTKTYSMVSNSDYPSGF